MEAAIGHMAQNMVNTHLTSRVEAQSNPIESNASEDTWVQETIDGETRNESDDVVSSHLVDVPVRQEKPDARCGSDSERDKDQGKVDESACKKCSDPLGQL